MINLHYCMMTSYFDYGVKLHPKDDMILLGYKIIKSEPVPIADCWWFRVENEIDNPPGYISRMPDGFRFSDEWDESSKEKRRMRTPPELKEDGSLTDYGKHVRGLEFK